MKWNDKPIVIKLDKLDTTPTDFTKFAESVDVKSLERVGEYLQAKAKEIKDET